MTAPRSYGFASPDDFRRVVRAALQNEEIDTATGANFLPPAVREAKVYVTVTAGKIATDRRDLYPGVFWVRNVNTQATAVESQDWYGVGTGQYLPQRGNQCVVLTPNGEALKKHTRYEGRVFGVAKANVGGAGEIDVTFVMVDLSDANDIIRVVSATADGTTGWYDAFVQEPAAAGNPAATDGVQIWAKNFGTGGVKAGPYMASFVTRQAGSTGRPVYGIVAEKVAAGANACKVDFPTRKSQCLEVEVTGWLGYCTGEDQDLKAAWSDSAGAWVGDKKVVTPIGEGTFKVHRNTTAPKYTSSIKVDGQETPFVGEDGGCEEADEDDDNQNPWQVWVFGDEVLCPNLGSGSGSEEVADCDPSRFKVKVRCATCEVELDCCAETGKEMPRSFCVKVTPKCCPDEVRVFRVSYDPLAVLINDGNYTSSGMEEPAWTSPWDRDVPWCGIQEILECGTPGSPATLLGWRVVVLCGVVYLQALISECPGEEHWGGNDSTVDVQVVSDWACDPIGGTAVLGAGRTPVPAEFPNTARGPCLTATHTGDDYGIEVELLPGPCDESAPTEDTPPKPKAVCETCVPSEDDECVGYPYSWLVDMTEFAGVPGFETTYTDGPLRIDYCRANCAVTAEPYHPTWLACAQLNEPAGTGGGNLSDSKVNFTRTTEGLTHFWYVEFTALPRYTEGGSPTPPAKFIYRLDAPLTPCCGPVVLTLVQAPWALGGPYTPPVGTPETITLTADGPCDCEDPIEDCPQCPEGAAAAVVVTVSGGTGDFAALNGVFRMPAATPTSGCNWESETGVTFGGWVDMGGGTMQFQGQVAITGGDPFVAYGGDVRASGDCCTAITMTEADYPDWSGTGTLPTITITPSGLPCSPPPPPPPPPPASPCLDESGEALESHPNVEASFLDGPFAGDHTLVWNSGAGVYENPEPRTVVITLACEGEGPFNLQAYVGATFGDAPAVTVTPSPFGLVFPGGPFGSSSSVTVALA